MPEPVDGLDLDVEFVGDVDWRSRPDPDGDLPDDDENRPAQDWLVDVLGFDPDSLFGDGE